MSVSEVIISLNWFHTRGERRTTEVQRQLTGSVSLSGVVVWIQLCYFCGILISIKERLQHHFYCLMILYGAPGS